MKKILFLTAVILITSCGSQKSASIDRAPDVQAAPPETPLTPESPILVNGHLYGLQDKTAFMQAPFNLWFKPKYESYTLEEETKKALKKGMKDVKIRAYMGTWCGDSKRETPMFYKLLDEIDFNEKDLTMITVDRTKKEPVELVSEYDILRVPTFIFYRDGEEIGRYVERPRESLEQDILKIITGEPYKHSYEN